MPAASAPPSPLAAMLDAHGAEVAGFVRARLPEPEASEVLQVTMLRASEHFAQLAAPERARAWLFRIARNAIADHHRALRAQRRRVSDGAALEHIEAPAAEGACACSVHLARALPRPYAEILEAVDVGGASLADAASALSITPNNATVRLHRARRALRESLMKHCGVTNARACLSCRCVMDGCCDP